MIDPDSSLVTRSVVGAGPFIIRKHTSSHIQIWKRVILLQDPEAGRVEHGRRNGVIFERIPDDIRGVTWVRTACAWVEDLVCIDGAPQAVCSNLRSEDCREVPVPHSLSGNICEFANTLCRS